MLEILATFIISILGGALGAFLLLRFWYMPAIGKALRDLYAFKANVSAVLGGFAVATALRCLFGRAKPNGTATATPEAAPHE